MNRRVLGALTALPLAITGFGTASATPAGPQLEPEYTDGVYIVQMIDPPIAANEGQVPGYAPTKPGKGKKINPKSAHVKKYAGHLKSQHDAALGKSGVSASKKLYDYSFTYNGFAAKLTGSEAAKLAKANGVVNVQKSQTYTIDTSSTPTFLGLDAKKGLWSQLGGTKSAGEDVLIGVIDSGIWPENLSFSDKVDNKGVPSTTGKVAYGALTGHEPFCQVGEDFTAKDCTNKLYVARYYNQGHGGDAGINKDRPWEYNSPRDYNGHGSHTAGTAGGNFGTPVTGQTSVIGPDGVSGMAPRARIAAYKALWSTETGDTASGTGVDLVAAIDQAVEDGVDVINYSISGSQTNFADPVEISFMFAADAGVFVAASAGNSGPAASTVAHPSPWITTVAAGTHNRATTTTLHLGNGQTYTGPSVADHGVSGDFIYAGDAAAKGGDEKPAGTNSTKAELCFSSADGGLALDKAKVAGKIVLCDRGATARVNKSLAVQEAGGIGMVLVNIPGGADGLNADFHTIPSVHLPIAASDALHAYAKTAGATATIDKFTLSFEAEAPFTAEFSSRGPLTAGAGDLLKPDLIAPGQDILAAYSPSVNGDEFNMISGTSMSSPHVAGLAALLKDRHPDWSPMAIKSALMTTGYDVKDDTDAAQKAFRQGAGHVDPNKAASPGLVYDSNANDWLAFLCGTTKAIIPGVCKDLVDRGYSTDASDMNVASIAIGDLAGSQTITRRVTNVDSTPSTYHASVTGVPGFDVKVTPNKLQLKPGETKEFKVTISTTSAEVGKYAGGYLNWKFGNRNVRSPIVVKPVALAAPAQVNASPSGASYDVTFGYSGEFTASARGLVKSTETKDSVPDDPGDDINGAIGTPSVRQLPFTVQQGTTHARWSLFGAGHPGDDLDLYLFQNQGGRWVNIEVSGNAGSNEEINLVNPQPGQYLMLVHGWGVVSGSTPTPFTLHSWLLGPNPAGNMTVAAPASATVGQKGSLALSFTGLTAGKWLGSVAYSGSSNMPNPTIVRVDVP
jgi:hypothetical protein